MPVGMKPPTFRFSRILCVSSFIPRYIYVSRKNRLAFCISLVFDAQILLLLSYTLVYVSSQLLSEYLLNLNIVAKQAYIVCHCHNILLLEVCVIVVCLHFIHDTFQWIIHDNRSLCKMLNRFFVLHNNELFSIYPWLEYMYVISFIFCYTFHIRV